MSFAGTLHVDPRAFGQPPAHPIHRQPVRFHTRPRQLAPHLRRALRKPPLPPSLLHQIAHLSDVGASFIPGGGSVVAAGDKALAALGIGGPLADVIHNPLLAQLALVPAVADVLEDAAGAVGGFFSGLFGGGDPIPVVPDPTGAFSREEIARMPGRIRTVEN